MFLQLFFLCMCVSLYAADAEHFFRQGYVCTASDSQAIAFYEKAYEDRVCGPAARYNAGLLEQDTRAKKSILMPLVTKSCFEFHDPAHTFDLQIKAYDLLMQAYKRDGKNENVFKVAFNQIILKQNYDIEQEHYGIAKEPELFPDEYAHALAIISDYVLRHSDFESGYLSSRQNAVDAIEHKLLLNKIFLSAAACGIPSAQLILILDADNYDRVGELESFYEQDPNGAIDLLCVAVEHGNKIARELAIFLSVNKKYTHEQKKLLASISKDHTQRKEHSERAVAASSSTSNVESVGSFKFYARKYLIEKGKKSA